MMWATPGVGSFGSGVTETAIPRFPAKNSIFDREDGGYSSVSRGDRSLF